MCSGGYCLEGTASVRASWAPSDCQWPQFSGVIALAGIGYWIPPVILTSMGGGLWSQPSVSYPGLCLRRHHQGSFCITHTEMFCLVHLISELLSSLFPGWWHWHFDWIFFFLNNKALHPHREAIVQGDTYRSSIHSDGSWDCAGNCKETKMSNSFGMSSAFLLRCHKTRKFWKCKLVQI